MWRGAFTPVVFLLTLYLSCAVRIIVKKCPITETAWKAKSQIFTCKSPLVYHCIKDDEGNLMETCLETYRVDPSSEGGCPWAAYFKDGDSTLGSVFHSCEETGCPQRNDSDYWTNELYKYPACLHIATISQSSVIEITSASNDANDMNGDMAQTVVIAVTMVAVVVLITVAAICIWCKRKSNKSTLGTDIENNADNLGMPLVKPESTLVTDIEKNADDSRMPFFRPDSVSSTDVESNNYARIRADRSNSSPEVPRICSEYTLSIFRKACLAGNTDMVKMFVDDFEDLLHTKDNEGCTPFHFAGFSGTVDLARYLFEKGGDINNKDNTGRTIVHIACRAGHTSLVNYLIGLDKDILNMKDNNGVTPLNCKDKEGRTIMHHACTRAEIELVKSLLRNQKDASEAKDSKGCTPFHLAGFSGSVELVQYLIDEGCDVNSTDNAGRTIMHCACNEGHIDLVKMLIGKYENAFPKTEHNCSMSFHRENNACQTNENSMLEKKHCGLDRPSIENERCPLNVKDSDGMTPFHHAGFSGSVTLVQYLIEKGCNINETDITGQTIIHHACQGGNIDLVIFLTKKNKDALVVEDNNGVKPFYKKDKDGRTIIHHACEKGNLNLVKLLIGLDKCAFNVKDKNGSTPVNLAGFFGSVELVKYLNYKGCDISSENNIGRTIVHNACQAGHINLVKYLIGQDKDLLKIKDMNDVMPSYCKDKEGRTIVHRACEKAELDLVKRLVVIDTEVLDVKDNNGCTPFHYTGFSGSVKLAKYLIYKGCDANGKDSTGRTILHYACQAGHIELVEYLIELDKDTLNMKDTNGITPLHSEDKNGRTIIHHVCEKGHFCLIKILGEIGNVAFDVKDKTGCTPLHLAGFSGSKKVVEFLLDKGCDINSKDNAGRTVAHNAFKAKNIHLIKVLRNFNKDIASIEDNNGKTPLHIADETSVNENSSRRSKSANAMLYRK